MNKNLAGAITKAIKMLEAADPVEAVSALEIALGQPMDEHTRSTVYKAKGEAELGDPEKAEILLGLIDLGTPKEESARELVIARDGNSVGYTTGGERPCTVEGCRGHRIGVRWEDGKMTFPCTEGMEYRNNARFNYWKLR